MTALAEAIHIIFTINLAVKKEEKVLILTDEGKRDIAKIFLEYGVKYAKAGAYLEMPIPSVNGQEPQEDIAQQMLDYDVIIALTSKSLSHTKARQRCTDKGIRIASMPGITTDILERSINIDYDALKERTNLIADALDKGSSVRITTMAGTDLSFSIVEREAHGRKSGLYTEKGFWGNLPEGEAFIAPVEGTVNGTMIIDGSIAGVGKVKNAKIVIKGGFAVSVDNKQLNDAIESVNDHNARNIAEFGIGTNEKARVTGIVLEDEKVFGTCHIALGNSIGFGGTIDVPFHVDCVMRSPTILIDNRSIMKDGKLLI